MQNIEKLPLSKFFNTRLFVVLCSIIFPLLVLNIVELNSNIDKFIIFILLGLGFLSGIYILKISIEKPILPYLMLQMIFIWIFIDKKLFSPFGLDLKLYALVFGLVVLVGAYFLIRNFKYLWKNFPVFRYIFIFFIINIFYCLFYHSDFRMATRVDPMLLHDADFLKHSAIAAGYSIDKDFSEGETQFVIYLGSLCPLLSIIISLMVFYGTKTINDMDKRFINIVTCIVYSLAAYFIASLTTIILGISKFFFFQYKLLGDFMGGDLAFHVYLSMLLILFMGFKLFLKNNNNKNTLLNFLLNSCMIINLALILMVDQKTNIIGLVLAITTFGIFYVKYCKKSLPKTDSIVNIPHKMGNNFLSIIFSLIPLVAIVALLFMNSDFVSYIFQNISERFSDSNTLSLRQLHWQYFAAEWLDNLNPFTFLFGFGIDSSRDLIFNISSMVNMITDKGPYPVIHAHSIFIQMFYEYGMVALIYFGAILSVLINNIRIIISKSFDNELGMNLKLFSNISLAIIIFFIVYYSMHPFNVANMIVFFCLLGIMESLRYSYENELRRRHV